MAQRIRRIVGVAAAVILFVVLAGATYQGVATALERRRFPHPGRLVDIGDRQLHIHCSGSGTPTVVLEAPAGGMSAAWGWVQPAVGRSTRVCSYDRAGLGWSEAGDAPYDPAAVPGQLHALLASAAERPPFVVVGDGLGAAFARLFAAHYGAEVVALVLVDPPPDANRPPAATMRLARTAPWLARTGVLRMMRLPAERTTGLPEPAAGPMAAFLHRPDHLTQAARELARWSDTLRLALDAPLPPGLQVVEVHVGDPPRPAFLTDAAQADQVTAAIAGVLGDAPAR